MAWTGPDRDTPTEGVVLPHETPGNPESTEEEKRHARFIAISFCFHTPLYMTVNSELLKRLILSLNENMTLHYEMFPLKNSGEATGTKLNLEISDSINKIHRVSCISRNLWRSQITHNISLNLSQEICSHVMNILMGACTRGMSRTGWILIPPLVLLLILKLLLLRRRRKRRKAASNSNGGAKQPSRSESPWELGLSKSFMSTECSWDTKSLPVWWIYCRILCSMGCDWWMLLTIKKKPMW